MEPSPIQSRKAAQRTSPLTARPRRRRPGRILLPLTLLLFLIPILLPASLESESTPPGKGLSFPRLSGDFEPLRAAFNRDGGAVRLLLLLDPT